MSVNYLFCILCYLFVIQMLPVVYCKENNKYKHFKTTCFYVYTMICFNYAAISYHRFSCRLRRNNPILTCYKLPYFNLFQRNLVVVVVVVLFVNIFNYTFCLYTDCIFVLLNSCGRFNFSRSLYCSSILNAKRTVTDKLGKFHLTAGSSYT